MSGHKTVKVRSRANIALAKYWGKADARLNVPAVGSISITLDSLYSETEVALDTALPADELVLNGKPRPEDVTKISACLDLLRKPAGIALAAYALCVWPANFKHAIDGIDVPHLASSWWYHGPRLALQPVIIWWALYCAEAIDWPWPRRASAG